MTVGSLFSGIGGFEKGFEDTGFETAFQVEIDPACRRVLAHHWPDVPRFEDVKDCGAHNLPPCDVLTFGSPCQDLSIAGKRAGLSGERSSLFHEGIRIIGELQPAVAVWENVPGALSSNAGRDFGAVLAAFRECGARDIAWRVLDSRYFGVAQRRRRVFVVADFRGERAGEVLFERQSLRGDTPAGRAAGEDVAGTLGGGAQSRGWCDDTDRMSFVPAPFRERGLSDYAEGFRTLRHWAGGEAGGGSETLVAHALTANGADASEDGTGRGTPLVTVAAPLTAPSGKGGFTDPVNDNILAFDTTQVTSVVNRSNPRAGDTDHPLAAGAHAPCVTFDWMSGLGAKATVEGVGTLLKSQHPAVMSSMTVRRLTPRECERLQGFPDDWTAMVSDSTRYRALGNAVTVSVARWIGRRLMEVCR